MLPESDPATQTQQTPAPSPKSSASPPEASPLDPRIPADGTDPFPADNHPPSTIPGLPKLPDWNDAGEDGERPPDRPGTDGLPDRQDFVDPGSMQDTPEQVRPKTDPAPKVAPTDQPEPRKVPTDPEPNSPFRDLPQMVALPPIEAASVSPVVWGPIHLQDREPCFMRLRGGDKAVRGNQSFVLRNADGGTAERDWEILLRDGDNQSKLAHLGIDADGRLGFRWETTAESSEIASNLGNCALVLSAPGKPTHVVALRQPIQSTPLVIDLEKPSPKSDLRIDSLPDPSVMYLEIVGVGGSDFQAKPAAVLASDKGEAWLTIEDAGSLLVLKVETAVRRGIISVEVGPHFQRAATAKPETFVVKRFPQVMNDATKYGQNLQIGIQNATQALNRNPTASQRQALQQTLAAMQQEEKDFQDFLLRLNQLHTFLDTRKNKLELKVRVYCDADSSEIDLLVASGSEDEAR
jgi:hypothetical protein